MHFEPDFAETLAKMGQYYAFDVEDCWIIDPATEQAWSVSKRGIRKEGLKHCVPLY